MTLSFATVAPAFIPDSTRSCYGSSLAYYPTRMSMRYSHPPCYLQDRDEIAGDVIIVKSRNRYVKVTAVSAHPLTVQSDINPRATVASIKVHFGGVKTSKWPRFALSHAHALGILHYRECYIAPMQVNLPTF